MSYKLSNVYLFKMFYNTKFYLNVMYANVWLIDRALFATSRCRGVGTGGARAPLKKFEKQKRPFCETYVLLKLTCLKTMKVPYLFSKNVYSSHKHIKAIKNYFLTSFLIFDKIKQNVNNNKAL